MRGEHEVAGHALSVQIVVVASLFVREGHVADTGLDAVRVLEFFDHRDAAGDATLNHLLLTRVLRDDELDHDLLLCLFVDAIAGNFTALQHVPAHLDSVWERIGLVVVGPCVFTLDQEAWTKHTFNLRDEYAFHLVLPVCFTSNRNHSTDC